MQGVGFRPMTWRIANETGVVGSVHNDAEGVLIRVGGDSRRVDDFLARIRTEAPPLSRVDSIEARTLAEQLDTREFRIVDSVGGGQRTHVAFDAATCAECAREVIDPFARRFGYPFTNCTHCGPRLSIVTAVPYDRRNTTMAKFEMCGECAREYGNPADRRFHAQPIACSACGPKIWIERFDYGLGEYQRLETTSAVKCLELAKQILVDGKTVAIRGLGGFHLACDATNAQAVDRLRHAKRRYGKPFALMARNIEQVQRYCRIDEMERTLLESAQAPIVLLEANGPDTLPEGVAPGMSTIGFMLPYTPLHLLLMHPLDFPLVMTSGNRSQEPQVIDNAVARSTFHELADVLLLHDRDIANRIDDSVVRVINGSPRLYRRARGYAPAPISLPEGFEAAPEILAFGAELKSTFCLIKDGDAVVSQHQGDLEDVQTFEDYQLNMRLYAEIFGAKPDVLAADLHPEYLSRKYAEQQAEQSDKPLELVQHHHAHIASCMVDNGLPLDTPGVLGVALDGLGFGEDGTIWGAEFMLADYRSYRRLATFVPIPMFGGTMAIREPWRSTYAFLNQNGEWSQFVHRYGDTELCRYLKDKPLATLDRMLDRNLNVPLASSCGRLFDAVAAALGICRDVALYEGQGAMLLESLATSAHLSDARQLPSYGFALTTNPVTGVEELTSAPMWASLLEDIASATPSALISARFHIGLSRAIVDLVEHLAQTAGEEARSGLPVVLTGGCFQNRILLSEVTHGLEHRGFECLSHKRMPTNDGGVALGQAVVAAARMLNSDQCYPAAPPAIVRA